MIEALPGIYLLRYPDGCYVGQSNNVSKRLTKHRTQLLDGIHPNKRLRLAFSQYGYLPEMTALEYCSLAELNDREIHWMDVHDCYPNGYNQKPGGGFTRPSVTTYTPTDLKTEFTTTDAIGVWVMILAVLAVIVFALSVPEAILPIALVFGIIYFFWNT